MNQFNNYNLYLDITQHKIIAVGKHCAMHTLDARLGNPSLWSDSAYYMRRIDSMPNKEHVLFYVTFSLLRDGSMSVRT